MHWSCKKGNPNMGENNCMKGKGKEKKPKKFVNMLAIPKREILLGINGKFSPDKSKPIRKKSS